MTERLPEHRRVHWREIDPRIGTESVDCSEPIDDSELESIGELKHQIRMLSINVLEKDIDIKNLKAAKQLVVSDGPSGHGPTNINPDVTCLKCDDNQRLPNDAIDLRNSLSQHPIDMLYITESDYDSSKTKPKEDVSTTDILEPRLFEHMSKISPATDDAAIQTDESNEHDDVSDDNTFGVVRQMQLTKMDNKYLEKEIALQTEKLEIFEGRYQKVNRQLLESETERSAATARAVAAEEMQQNLRDQLNELRRRQEKDVTPSFHNQFTGTYHHIEYESNRLQSELNSVRIERDDLRARLEISDFEVKRLRQDIENYRNALDEKCPSLLVSSMQRTDILTKSRFIAMEVALNTACSARDDALRRLEYVTTKFEAASKAVYELDAERKVQVSQLEAKLEVSSHKLTTYENMEAELDRAIEAFSDRCYEDMLPFDLLEGSAGLLRHLHESDAPGPMLPTLASRRLEHSLKLSRRLAESERIKATLQEDKQKLEKELEISKAEAARLSCLLSAIDTPTNCLGAALVSRDSQITRLQQEKRRLQQKLAKLYSCTKNLVAERKAMLEDVQELIYSENASVDVPEEEENKPPPMKTHLPRKTFESYQ